MSDPTITVGAGGATVANGWPSCRQQRSLAEHLGTWHPCHPQIGGEHNGHWTFGQSTREQRQSARCARGEGQVLPPSRPPRAHTIEARVATAWRELSRRR